MVLSLIATSVPETYVGLLLVSALGWLGLLLISLIGLVVHYNRQRTVRPRLEHIVAFLGLAALIALVYGDVSKRVAYFASCSSMDQLAERARTDPESVQNESWVGLFPIRKLSISDGGVCFLVRGAGMFEGGGFAYSESGPPSVTDKSNGPDFFRYYRGNWYLWVSNQ